MDRNKFTQQFSRRLVHLMKEIGFTSNRSTGGVDVTKLAKTAGCSYQMARRYVLGKALPELFVLPKIASWLNTSASWLLFGDDEIQTAKKNRSDITIEIEPKLLKHILERSVVLFTLAENKDEIINFIVDCIYDVSHLNAESDTIHKVIDMMFSSTKFLKSSKAG